MKLNQQIKKILDDYLNDIIESTKGKQGKPTQKAVKAIKDIVKETEDEIIKEFKKELGG